MSLGAEDDKIDWLSAGAAIASISVVGICIGLGMPLLSVILEQRGYSASMIGLNTAFAGLASIGAAPFAAPIASRFGVVPAMIAMIILGGFSFAGFYLFEPFWAWLLLRSSLHFALTVLFILSEYWISHSAPAKKRGLMLGIYATMLSLGFALGPFIFSLTGSKGFLPFGLACGIIALAIIPVLIARKHSPDFDDAEHVPFLPYITKVPTATAAVLVFGAVETGGFALLPLYGSRIGYSESDTALLMTMIGIGNVVFQIPIGMLSDRIQLQLPIVLVQWTKAEQQVGFMILRPEKRIDRLPLCFPPGLGNLRNRVGHPTLSVRIKGIEGGKQRIDSVADALQPVVILLPRSKLRTRRITNRTPIVRYRHRAIDSDSNIGCLVLHPRNRRKQFCHSRLHRKLISLKRPALNIQDHGTR